MGYEWFGGRCFEKFSAQYANAAHLAFTLKSLLLLVVSFLFLQVTEWLRLTFRGYFVHCSLAPLHGRGQWSKRMTVLVQKTDDFIIHSWRTKPCLKISIFLVGLFWINNFLTLFSGSSQNIRFLEVFLVGGGTSRTKRRRSMWIALVRSSLCSVLKEKLIIQIFFVDVVCCEGSKIW